MLYAPPPTSTRPTPTYPNKYPIIHTSLLCTPRNEYDPRATTPLSSAFSCEIYADSGEQSHVQYLCKIQENIDRNGPNRPLQKSFGVDGVYPEWEIIALRKAVRLRSVWGNVRFCVRTNRVRLRINQGIVEKYEYEVKGPALVIWSQCSDSQNKLLQDVYDRDNASLVSSLVDDIVSGVIAEIHNKPQLQKIDTSSESTTRRPEVESSSLDTSSVKKQRNVTFAPSKESNSDPHPVVRFLVWFCAFSSD